ncbi:putative retrotransposon hot spot (RHS) protein [Trypanosoma theileri]|uniref:Putative retrotransposon hot spot (RHS) protein n=1 Tax=Trypanosoma theileri TaxID=67003 RepID=A0A1X0NUV1_9TRYP|nr:putative retrotransposon hot spot (RHS) protein [Trypanosoma theileri]ORC88475.1 putative retrotransposon hot spot (RHS) protein [Trypanosoma theileri]
MIVTSRKTTSHTKKKAKSLKNTQDPKSLKNITTWRTYTGLVLTFVTCIDTIVTVSSLPVISSHIDAVPLSLSTMLLGQSLFYFFQLYSTFVAERFARFSNGMTAYAMTLAATSMSTLVMATALREGSIFLFILTRLLNGLFRHTILLGAFAFHELPATCKSYDMKKFTTFSLIIAVLLGGFLGDYGPGPASTVDILAAVEFCTAIVVGVLSLTLVRKPKVFPAVQTVGAYKEWLFKQSYRDCIVFIPLCLTLFCASMGQCLYPFIDRRGFHLRYSIIGIHMAIVFFIQTTVAPLFLERYSGKNRLLIYISAVLLAFVSWVSNLISDNGIGFYLIVTLLCTDLSASLLEFSFTATALNSFRPSERVFAQKLARHIKQTIKQWSPVVLISSEQIFAERKDGTRIAMFPLAFGIVVFALTNRISLSLIATIVICVVLVSSPPVDDAKMWSDTIITIQSILRFPLTGNFGFAS